MSVAEELLDTGDYESREDFMEDVLGAFDEGKSVFIHGPDHEEYGREAYIQANKKAASDNLWAQISLNPMDWLNPDLYKVNKQEVEEGFRINYREI